MADDDSDNPSAVDVPDWFRFFLHEFQNESDRAAVILTCTMIDDGLRKLLEAHMLSCPSASDPLFYGANAPLSTFSARIETAHRLGLITRDFASGLNTLRRIRNSFAHDVAGCSFGSQSVRDRVDSLTHLSRATKNDIEEIEGYSWSNARDRFCYVVGYFLFCLKRGREEIASADDEHAIDCKFT